MNVLLIIGIMFLASLYAFACTIAMIATREIRERFVREALRILLLVAMLFASVIFGKYQIWFLVTTVISFISYLFTMALITVASD